MMAEAAGDNNNKESNISVSQDRFACAICLGLLKDPVALACGHNYCMGCITNCWDRQDAPECRCPQCRMAFTPRPVLRRNLLLAEMVAKLRVDTHTAGEAAGVTPTAAAVAPGEVECTACVVGRKRKAEKSCLDCLASYCESHFNKHEEFQWGKRHKVVAAVARLEEKLCSKHSKPLEVWCSTDQVCVCLLCIIDDHKGHDIITAAAAKAEKLVGQLARATNELSTSFKKQITQREKEFEQLRRAVEPFTDSVKASLDASDKTFQELITFLESKCSELKDLIKAREKAGLSEADQLEGRLRNILQDLKQKDSELVQLSYTDDPVHFLQNLPSLCPQDLQINVGTAPMYFGAVERLLSNLYRHVSDCLQNNANVIASHVNQVLIEDTTRTELMHVFCQPKVDKDQRFSDHPRQEVCTYDRPQHARYYWELEWEAKDLPQHDGGIPVLKIAVVEADINRRAHGLKSEFGKNDKSWSLDCFQSVFKFSHANETIEINRPITSRVGVYVCRGAGSLCSTVAFYGIYGQKAILLHRVDNISTSRWTQLVPGFYNDINTTFKIC